MQLQSGTFLRGGKYVYRIERVLGQGGFGITYLAYAQVQVQGPLGMIESDVKVAIKEFFMKDLCNREEVTSCVSVPSVGSRDLVDRFCKKFRKEADNIAALNHPDIIKVIDVFEENKTAYYVMEYVEGGSLQDWVKQRGALPEKEALGYIRQVASALDYIHQRKMNHLDIKPANILRKPDGHVVLIDFGLSKQYDEKGEQTSSTPVGVSTGYAPAEQSKPGGVGQFSAPTDIYSLGATCYKLVTGITPPDALDLIDDGLPSLPDYLSRSTIQAITKSMEPVRRNRPQSISEFLALLNEGIKPVEEDKEDLKEEEDTKIDHPVIPVTLIPKPDLIPKSGSILSKELMFFCGIVISLIAFGVLINRNNVSYRAEVEPVAVSVVKPVVEKIENGERITVEGVSYDMVYVAGGDFNMGSDNGDGDERPVHPVSLSSYYIGKTEVTQALWKAVMGNNPSSFEGDDLPVEMVSWNDCQEFIKKLNTLSGKTFRLPTEAEWEYAARGGTKQESFKYSGSNDLKKVGWSNENAVNKTYSVGKLVPNGLGLYDMSGNVWEWCSDWYGDYPSSKQTNPTGPTTGSRRVYRGGGWIGNADRCRVSNRGSDGPGDRGGSLGFRLALVRRWFIPSHL